MDEYKPLPSTALALPFEVRQSVMAAAKLPSLMAVAAATPAIRGFHSSTFQVKVSTFRRVHVSNFRIGVDTFCGLFWEIASAKTSQVEPST